ncbi:TolC family protein [Ohtaekwangia koreensis]|uniref:Outer membrane protein TolC n=1 Tax=Ohtaekwangia koreensis TaxID=688867 RepID=A0A1T5K1S1_9BACT|nr:TolC family protein [Ohtaekwangia koreensis]SKC57722.1 Outer membrane protein TolC [Ohtaekwangia koreensis]
MNKLYSSLSIFFLLFAISSFAYGQTVLALEDIIARSKGQSPASKQAETRKENRYWQYRYYKTNYNPQLRLEGSLPSYYKRVNQIPQQDGTFRYIPVEQTNNNVTLGLEQPIQWTGGTISANTGLGYFKDFNDNTSLSEQWSGTVMNVQLNQPLFAFNQLRWDRKTEPLRYEESKREYIEQMEFISREAVSRFFDVLQAQINLQIATFNLANNDTIYKIERGRYNIGTTSQDKLLQVELQLLRSRQGVAQATLDQETARLQLRTYIGLSKDENFALSLPEYIPAFDVTVDEALQYAQKNRAAYIAFERRRIEADREIAQARGQRFQTELTAAFGLNNNGLMLDDVYTDPSELQQFNLTLNVPVLDWGRNKSRMRTAMANKKLNDYVIAQDEVNFEQEIMTQVRQFEMLRLQIEITKKADEVATERYNVAQNRYLIGKIDITNLNIALTEKDDAKRSYIQALKSFWTAYYDLRRLTLYDFSTKQLLYTPE